jgi:anaphase-promoting complex subunit 2
MLRDVLDSRKVDEIIWKEQNNTKDEPRNSKQQPELHAKILSRLFWPLMSDQGFKLPPSVVSQQTSYEKGFESLKHSRKLTWLNSMGHVEVELHLSDRVVSEEVLPYQASVIYAFESQTSPLSITSLASQLEMSTTLARSACIFWLSRRVLTETTKDHFAVLENLPPDSSSSNPNTTSSDLQTTSSSNPTSNHPSATADAAAAAAAELASLAAAKEAAEHDRKQKMAMYHQFITSMLTNQGAMPLQRIAMMLGIVVPGGFPFSNEELKEFLAGMVKEGGLEVGMGGNYRVVK